MLEGDARPSDASDARVTHIRERVLEAQRSGETLLAFDLADAALADFPGDEKLTYDAILALARLGSTEQAAARYATAGFDLSVDPDVAALGARISKDRSLGMVGARRREFARLAARQYGAIGERTGQAYPEVNAATMSLIAGDNAEATRHARAALEAADGTDYWAAATAAEAHLVLGDIPSARAALAAAARLTRDLGAIGTTRRQLAFICEHLQLEVTDILDALGGPVVVHYCGHLADKRPQFDVDAQSRVAGAISRVVAEIQPTHAYGSLASGADIMWAEVLLDAGAVLHAVLPCSVDHFLSSSVQSAGEEWAARFRACLERATDVRFATEHAATADESLYRHCSDVAMGLAIHHGRQFAVPAHQLAVWDGSLSGRTAGTASDIARWARTGLPTTAVTPQGTVRSVEAAEAATIEIPSATSGERVIRAVLFADFNGFSALDDDQTASFADSVLPQVARILDAFDLEHRNSWGDGLVAVAEDPLALARCAYQLATADLGLTSAGLPPTLLPRVATHVGAVFPRFDPIRRAPGIYGTQMTRAARIEPIVPTGAAFATEAMVAALELDPKGDVGCEYVGHMPTAKNHGRLRMYSLKPKR